jgi:tripartite-type tricarboxylate transporter receptor subunit TctC
VKLPRRQFLQFAGATAAASIVPRPASALDYPTKPVRLIVPQAAGSTSDIVARLVSQWLSDRLGQQFIVENRPGAGSNIATEAVVKAEPDGNTLLMATAANAVNATLYEKLSFNFIRDVAPVVGIIRVPNVMEVNPSLPVRSVPDFIAYAKANPGRINFASGGVGNTQHMSGELFKLMAGVNMVHVPYRGSGPAIADLIAGQVQLMFDAMPSSIGYLRAGQLRPLAVTTISRSDALPDLPTVADFLPGFATEAWIGIGAPKNTPNEIIGKLNKEVNAALVDPKVKSRLADLGGTVIGGSPSDFAKFIIDETDKWAKVVKFSGAKPD